MLFNTLKFVLNNEAAITQDKVKQAGGSQI